MRGGGGGRRGSGCINGTECVEREKMISWVRPEGGCEDEALGARETIESWIVSETGDMSTNEALCHASYEVEVKPERILKSPVGCAERRGREPGGGDGTPQPTHQRRETKNRISSPKCIFAWNLTQSALRAPA